MTYQLGLGDKNCSLLLTSFSMHETLPDHRSALSRVIDGLSAQRRSNAYNTSLTFLSALTVT